MAVDAVILAGAIAEPEMDPSGGQLSRAMLPVGDRTMLQWLVDAMKQSKEVRNINVVGRVIAADVDRVIEPRETFLENVMMGVASVSGERILISSSDIPFVTAEAVDDFIQRASVTDADFYFPIIPKEDCLEKYPQLKRTYVKTREGTFTGGNMVLVSREFMQRNEKIIAEVYNQRKNVLKLAGLIGFSTLLRVILAQTVLPALLPVPMLEQTAARMLGGRVKAVVTRYPEIGEDIDKPEDLAVARDILGK